MSTHTLRESVISALFESVPAPCGVAMRFCQRSEKSRVAYVNFLVDLVKHQQDAIQPLPREKKRPV